MAYSFSIENIDHNLLNVLLIDRTTEKNIIWATNDYKNISATDEIKFEQRDLIRPRFEKFCEQQKNRTRDKAEIFTPSWLCNEQNNLIDEEWFGKVDVFNKIIDVKNHLWETTSEAIIFDGEKSWQSYVEANRLEIACGEAPYLVSRYDTVSGEPIPVKNRIGLLDRKLRVVGENVNEIEDWLSWAKKAVQSVYGYEFQGDNLFIARCNIFLTVQEFFFDKYKFDCDVDPVFLKEIEEIAEIISWNLWQMDGLKGIIPYSDKQKKFTQTKLAFKSEENVEIENKSETKDKSKIFCKIKDWTTGEEKDFINLGVKENESV